MHNTRNKILKIVFFIFIFIFFCILFVLGLGYFKYKNAIKKLSINDAVTQIRNNENFTNIQDISDEFKTAIVSIEDHRFYDHKGIDFISIVHSLYVDLKIKSLDYGASTITQQLARNIYFSQEKSPIRKVAEVFIADELEKNYSKDEILELYLNIIYFGNGFYGINDASYGYFSKSPKDLNHYEATYLAGLPNAPSVYSTDTELGEQRRLQVESAMKNQSE